MGRWKHLFFDLDGTLIDTSEGILVSAAYAFETLGVVVPCEAELRKMIGPPLRETFPKLGVPSDLVEEAVRIYREKYVGQGARFLCHAYEGIEETLQQLQEDGFRLFVATAKPEHMAMDVLQKCQLEKYFSLIAGASLDNTRDKKADILRYLLAKERFDSMPILIGDTRYDVEGAKIVGLPCLGVTWGFDTPEMILKEGAIDLVHTPEEMVRYLQKEM